MSTPELNLSEFTFAENLPDNVVQTPTFLEGRLGKTFYQAYERERVNTYGNNPNLKLALIGDEITGSTFFDVVLANQLLSGVKGNPRTTLPADLNRPEVLEMVRGKHYVDSPALVIRSLEDDIEPRNNSLARTLAEYIDVARLAKEPVLMHGFTLQNWPEDKEGYGLKVVPTDKFEAHYDNRLLAEWNNYKFDNTDEKGLPVVLDKVRGSRRWFARKTGLSGVSLNTNLATASDWYRLAGSPVFGRVVVVSGEATRKM